SRHSRKRARPATNYKPNIRCFASNLNQKVRSFGFAQHRHPCYVLRPERVQLRRLCFCVHTWDNTSLPAQSRGKPEKLDFILKKNSIHPQKSQSVERPPARAATKSMANIHIGIKTG